MSAASVAGSSGIDASPSTRRLVPGLAALEEGFGSAYERYAVGHLTESLVRALAMKTVAEWPANGVLGVPGLKSLPLGAAGCEVTLLSPSASLLDGARRLWQAAGVALPRVVVADPETPNNDEYGSHDLVWSFCAFEHARSHERLAAAMVRASRRFVLVFVQNAWMPGVHLHRLQHALERRAWDHGRLRAMRAEFVAGALERAGAHVLTIGGCDLPPWPDLDVKLPRLRRRRLSQTSRPYGPSDPVLDFTSAAEVLAHPPPLSSAMRALVRWHDEVELALPRAVLRFIAHHPYVLAEKP